MEFSWKRMENGIFDYLQKFNGQRFEQRVKACTERELSVENTIFYRK